MPYKRKLTSYFPQSKRFRGAKSGMAVVKTSASRRLYKKGKRKPDRIKTYTYAFSSICTDKGTIVYMNSWSLGLGPQQRSSDIEILKSMYIRLTVALSENAASQVKTYVVKWALIVDQVPGETLVGVADVYKTCPSPYPYVQCAYIADDNHSRFQVLRSGFLSLSGNGLAVGSSTRTGCPAMKNMASINKFCKNLNVRCVYDADSATGDIASIKRGAVYLVIWPDVEIRYGFSCTMYHRNGNA
ncbi:coat protein [Tomato pseudo-curly top virus]|uniref:Capsid protein n=1 Tax=Tomato pseudo-curly top virus TaxID=49267 RepID=CAPSD_TPCTV|nr:coat protein [Tomato pseudo-curly top virus]Q88886.1 RecName: Full=Capsid protein; AltName: Full=Coat protein; Short=CP [Tomato pseudo-curly top virus]CAA59221.1 coat protein [Tomato pseudo-curly top virus]